MLPRPTFLQVAGSGPAPDSQKVAQAVQNHHTTCHALRLGAVLGTRFSLRALTYQEVYTQLQKAGTTSANMWTTWAPVFAGRNVRMRNTQAGHPGQ